MRTRGNIVVSEIKLGDIQYEYLRFVKDHWIGLEQFKLYKKCIALKVISLPVRNSDATWVWLTETLQHKELIMYRVYEDTTQGAPYLFDHKRWEAEIWA